MRGLAATLAVVNELLESDVVRTVDSWVDLAWAFVATRAADFGLRLIAAIALYYVGRWVANLAVGIVRAALERAKIETMLVRFATNVLYALLMLMIVIGALQLLGVDMTSMTAMIAAAGFAIGLALQGSLSNFASGILLVIFKPFHVGDQVEAGGTAGRVEEIHLFTTILRTGDNSRIVVPNGQITGGVITNRSAFPTRRIDLLISCGYADDLRSVKAFLERLLAEHPQVLADPPPVVGVEELAESGINLCVRPWVNTADYANVRRDLLEQIKLGFDAMGFTIPFPSRDLYVYSGSGAATQAPPLLNSPASPAAHRAA